MIWTGSWSLPVSTSSDPGMVGSCRNHEPGCERDEHCPPKRCGAPRRRPAAIRCPADRGCRRSDLSGEATTERRWHRLAGSARPPMDQGARPVCEHRRSEDCGTLSTSSRRHPERDGLRCLSGATHVTRYDNWVNELARKIGRSPGAVPALHQAFTTQRYENLRHPARRARTLLGRRRQVEAALGPTESLLRISPSSAVSPSWSDSRTHTA